MKTNPLNQKLAKKPPGRPGSPKVMSDLQSGRQGENSRSATPLRKAQIRKRESYYRKRAQHLKQNRKNINNPNPLI